MYCDPSEQTGRLGNRRDAWADLRSVLGCSCGPGRRRGALALNADRSRQCGRPVTGRGIRLAGALVGARGTCSRSRWSHRRSRLSGGHSSPGGSIGTRGSSRLVEVATRSGLPEPAIAGLRFSLERGRGRTAVPVRSALLGAVLAVDVIVATLTFGSSLATLDSHPCAVRVELELRHRLSGDEQRSPGGRKPSAHDRDVVRLDRVQVRQCADRRSDRPRSAYPGSRHSRPAHSLGPRTRREQPDRPRRGDPGRPAQEGRCTPSGQLRRPQGRPVYTATTPARSSARPLCQRSARAASSSLDGNRRPSPTAGSSRHLERRSAMPDPNLDGPTMYVVRTQERRHTSAGHSSLQRIAESPDKAVADDPNDEGDTSSCSGCNVLPRS